jgi:hypothetical protein
MSSISTCEASSLDLSVAEMDSAVTPEVFASASAWVSVGAAMARRGWVVEKGREFRVIVDEVGLDTLKAARKTEARASIGRTGRGAKRRAKDVFCEFKELEIRASKTATSASFDIASLAATESSFSLGGSATYSESNGEQAINALSNSKNRPTSSVTV